MISNTKFKCSFFFECTFLILFGSNNINNHRNRKRKKKKKSTNKNNWKHSKLLTIPRTKNIIIGCILSAAEMKLRFVWDFLEFNVINKWNKQLFNVVWEVKWMAKSRQWVCATTIKQINRTKYWLHYDVCLCRTVYNNQLH